MPREPEIRSIIKREVQHISFIILKFSFYHEILHLIVSRYNHRIREIQNIRQLNVHFIEKLKIDILSKLKFFFIYFCRKNYNRITPIVTN